MGFLGASRGRLRGILGSLGGVRRRVGVVLGASWSPTKNEEKVQHPLGENTSGGPNWWAVNARRLDKLLRAIYADFLSFRIVWANV